MDWSSIVAVAGAGVEFALLDSRQVPGGRWEEASRSLPLRSGSAMIVEPRTGWPEAAIRSAIITMTEVVFHHVGILLPGRADIERYTRDLALPMDSDEYVPAFDCDAIFLG